MSGSFKNNFSFLDLPFIKCWGRILFLTKKFLFITVGFSSFSLFNAQLIREDTADNLDLIYVNCKEENIMNEVAGIKIYCVKK